VGIGLVPEHVWGTSPRSSHLKQNSVLSLKTSHVIDEKPCGPRRKINIETLAYGMPAPKGHLLWRVNEI
jgi:hypothetical protein